MLVYQGWVFKTSPCADQLRCSSNDSHVAPKRQNWISYCIVLTWYVSAQLKAGCTQHRARKAETSLPPQGLISSCSSCHSHCHPWTHRQKPCRLPTSLAVYATKKATAPAKPGASVSSLNDLFAPLATSMLQIRQTFWPVSTLNEAPFLLTTTQVWCQIPCKAILPVALQ